MDKDFDKNFLKPGDAGFEYDKVVDFNNEGNDGWTEDQVEGGLYALGHEVTDTNVEWFMGAAEATAKARTAKAQAQVLDTIVGATSFRPRIAKIQSRKLPPKR